MTATAEDVGPVGYMETLMPDYPKLLEKLGIDGLEELRRPIAEELAKRPDRRVPPTTHPVGPGTTPGPDDDLRPRS
jgi:hypothetical protein